MTGHIDLESFNEYVCGDEDMETFSKKPFSAVRNIVKTGLGVALGVGTGAVGYANQMRNVGKDTAPVFTKISNATDKIATKANNIAGRDGNYIMGRREANVTSALGAAIVGTSLAKGIAKAVINHKAKKFANALNKGSVATTKIGKDTGAVFTGK